MDFPKAIRKILIDKNLSHGELAQKLGLSKQVFSDFLNRREDYRLNADIVRIADALGLDVALTLIDRETGQRYEIK